jgi:hypothetical protein
MSMFGRILWTAHVWLTATMTLVAGIPLADCICPDGTRKVFCSGCAANEARCCQTASCSPSPQANSNGPVKRAACCAHSAVPKTPTNQTTLGSKTVRQQPQQKPGPDGQVTALGCRRALAEQQAPVVTSAEKSRPESVLALALPAVAVPIAFLTKAPPCPLAWQSYRLPPPTDLVIVLQHFVI